MRYLLILISFSAIGCAGPVYQKDGATHRDWLHDKTKCEALAGQAGYNTSSIAEAIVRKRFIRDCVMGEGWEPK